MIRNLLGLGLLAGASQATSPISVVCNTDNTIDVAVAYDQEAEVLEFSYGDCNMATSRANFTQNADFGFAFTLDVDVCNMNDKLRTLQYNQTASMRIGRKSGGQELTLATFQIDSYCTYTSSYKVKFNYGDIEAETATYSSDAGLVNISFALKSYNSNFSAEEAHSSSAGKMINLGLSITNANFDHADDIAASSSGKVFVPEKCKVFNEDGDEYNLFDSGSSCSNDDIDFSMTYDQDKNMWQFSHILFLLNSDRVSKLHLECDVIVCDKKESSQCDAVVRACTRPVDGEIAWGQYSNCTKSCYNGGNDPMGTQTKNGVCTPPKFFGSACGALSDTKNCTSTPRCPIDGNWAAFSNWTDCTKPCGNGTQSRDRTCSAPAKEFGGKDCVGDASETQNCNVDACPIDGNWTVWGSWSECSEPCGGGIQSKNRTCTNPKPAFRGRPCDGNATETRACNEIACCDPKVECCPNEDWRDRLDNIDCQGAFDKLADQYWNEGDSDWGNYHDDICNSNYFGGQNYNDDSLGSWWDNCCPTKYDELDHCSGA